MEVQENASVDAASTATPSEVSANANAQTPQSVSQPSATDSSAKAPQAEAYTPNWKYKVLDKEEEFPEWIKPAVTKKEYEDYLRDVHTKAKGIDFVKSERDKLKQEYTTYKGQYEPVVKSLQEAYKAYERGDMDLAFKHLGIPEKVLMETVLKKLQQEELPPERKQEYNRMTELQRQNWLQQEQLQQMQQTYQQFQVQARTQELNQALQSPEVKSIETAYDQANGPGSFKQFVIAQAHAHLTTTGEDLSAAEAVARVSRLFKGLSPQQQVAQKATQNRDVPVIPVAKGGGNSPVQKQVTSLDDLRKLAQQKSGY